MTMNTTASMAAIAKLRDKYIKTQRDIIFQKHLDLLLQRDDTGGLLPKPVIFTATGDTHGIALVEGSGGGKTSLVHHVLDNHPVLQSDDPGYRPVIGVRVPSPATLKSLGWEILRETGYSEVSVSRKEWDIWRLVRARLRMLGTVVLWIDEAHDLFRAGKGIEDILKMLKSVMQGEGAVILVLTGVDKLWQMASYDDQVKRRYSKVTMPSISAATHEKSLRSLVQSFCDEAGLLPPREVDLIDRLVYASRGRFGRCIENIIAALEMTVLKNETQVTVQHFAESWAMQEGAVPGMNVFLSPRWTDIDLAKLHEAR
ncbi:TniB family NTP-binding protein [Pseudosulfitobacter koreensis]|uniref:TniB family NTP-binding protein n=1 Tax=Pseudosulfitobacter koreensis TaxID=2968472 RepID=A0ABT1Z2G6_9RHOB|nr:TniB family NTP-binding protein [Pseudosulfitobacter koreense]MCR8827328.1 TniB family NTP-binding protein [Pseudosulfitobacter koreense]